MPAQFSISEVEDNEEGWGPTSIPDHLAGVPYAPYGKGDKVGKISDFTQAAGKYGGGRFGQQQQQPGVAVLNYFHTEEEDSFHLVDNKPEKRNKGVRRFQPNRFQQQRQREQERRAEQEKDQRGQRKQQRKQQQQYQNYRENQRQVVYSSSVDIRPEWVVKEQIPFTSLLKLNYQVSEPEDLKFCGKLQYYDKSLDRITPRLEKPLQRTKKTFRSVTTSDDPVIRELAEKGVGRVFATDALITTLMCATRSVYSWDIIVERQGDFLFFDKRDGSNLDLLTVSETAPESVAEEKDNMNGVQQLSREATAVNQSFSQQVLQEGKLYDCGEPSPFQAEGKEHLASTAYRYRKWNIAEDVDLVVRCEVDGVMDYKGERQLLLIKALNEFDSKSSGVSWRQKLETQRGAVLATELKNNANKLAKWTAAAHLSGSDMIKLGYLTRATPKDNLHHVILSTQVCKPKDFAMQINLSMDNCWGIVRALVDLCLKLEEGKYLLIKDPNKPIIRLYEIAADAFETNYTEEPIPQDELDSAPLDAGTAKKGDDDEDDE